MLHKSIISVVPLDSLYVEMNKCNKYTQGTFYFFTKEIIWLKQYQNSFYIYMYSYSCVFQHCQRCLLVVVFRYIWGRSKHSKQKPEQGFVQFFLLHPYYNRTNLILQLLLNKSREFNIYFSKYFYKQNILYQINKR